MIVGKGSYDFTAETFTGTKHADLLYCYSEDKGTGTVPACKTDKDATSGTTHDTGKREWMYDAVTNRTTTYSYSAEGRLRTASTTDSAGTVTAKYNYRYDRNGNRITDSDESKSRRHVHDNADALCLTDTATGATWPALSDTRHKCTTSSSSTATAPADSALTAYAYDGNGAFTSAKTSTDTTSGAWNPRQQLTSYDPFGANTASTFGYRGSGNSDRISRTNPAAGYANGLLGIQAETDANGKRQTVVRDPEGTLVGLRRPDGTMSYYQLDAQGGVSD